MTQHDELATFLPPQVEPKGRKMLSCQPETYEKITKLSEEMKVPRSRVVMALVDYYLEGE